MGNTSCPAVQVSMAKWHLQHLDFILEHHSQVATPFQLCPPTLFGEIIIINGLRAQACLGSEDLRQGAYEVLWRVHEFSPGVWAESKAMGLEAWGLAGQVYQHAVAL